MVSKSTLYRPISKRVLEKLEVHQWIYNTNLELHINSLRFRDCFMLYIKMERGLDSSLDIITTEYRLTTFLTMLSQLILH